MRDAFATYGTLGPGKPNHHQLAQIRGTWTSGFVRGTLHQRGWGAELGFPGIVLNEDAEEVSVDVLESEELDAHWSRLDAFEGPGYRRVRCHVRTATGLVSAFIYEIAEPRSES